MAGVDGTLMVYCGFVLGKGVKGTEELREKAKRALEGQT